MLAPVWENELLCYYRLSFFENCNFDIYIYMPVGVHGYFATSSLGFRRSGNRNEYDMRCMGAISAASTAVTHPLKCSCL